jgi:inorganic triphosphatase YgiF
MARSLTVAVAEGAVTPGETDPVETELKLSAIGPGPLRRLTNVPALGDIPLGRPERFLELDHYLDTNDGRLASARWACRLRDRSGDHVVSLKGPPVAGSDLGGALHRRPEIEGPASAQLDPDTWPASAARDRLVQLSGGRPLSVQFILRQTRTQRAVWDDVHRVGTLSLDWVQVVREDVLAGRMWGVELELADPAVGGSNGTASYLPRLLEDLVSFGGLTVEPLTKLERAMALLGDARS